MSKTKNVTFSFPYAGALGILFIGLKLAEVGVVATWSWLWVLSPFWIPIAFVLGILAVALVVAIIVAILQAIIQ